MENLKEYYELCKTINPKTFNYGRWEVNDNCGTIGCLWGHAPILLPDKIFRFKVNTTTRLISTKSYYESKVIWSHNNLGAIYEYFNPITKNEEFALNAIFLGDGNYINGRLIEAIPSDVMQSYNLEYALDRFAEVLNILGLD